MQDLITCVPLPTRSWDRESHRRDAFPSAPLQEISVREAPFSPLLSLAPSLSQLVIFTHLSRRASFGLDRLALWACTDWPGPSGVTGALCSDLFSFTSEWFVCLFVWTRYCCQYLQVACEYGKLSSLVFSQIRMLSDNFLPHLPKCTADKIQQAVFPWDRIFPSSGYGTVTHRTILRLSTLFDLHGVCTNRLEGCTRSFVCAANLWALE